MHISPKTPSNVPKIGRGGPVTDSVFEEIADIYGNHDKFLAPVLSFKGKEWGPQPAGEGLVDRDRRHDRWAHLSSLSFNLQLSDSSQALSLQTLALPPEANYALRDLTLDAGHHKVAVEYSSGGTSSRKVDLLEFDLGQPQLPKTLTQLDKPSQAIEYDSEGHLLLAQGSQVLRWEEGQLQPYLELPHLVDDLHTLSDGGLCIRTKLPNNLRYALHYQPPQGEELYSLALSDLAPESFSEQRSWSTPPFLHSLSNREFEDFLENSTSPDLWFLTSHPDHLESPQGDSAIHWIQSVKQIYAIDHLQDRGLLAKLSHSGRFQRGLDPQSARWSPDGRYFGVNSKSESPDPLVDSWIWDSQTQQSLVLPGVLQFRFVPQSAGVVGGGAQPPLDHHDILLLPQNRTLTDLAQVAQQDWYQEQLQLPWVERQRDTLLLRNHQGDLRNTITLQPQEQSWLSLDGRHLICLDAEQKQAQIYSLLWPKVPLTTPPASHCFWDQERQRLGLIDPSDQLHFYPIAEIEQAPWYREAMQQQVLGTSAPAAPVERGEQGTRVNGLLMPTRSKA